jgi:hypothetical protein
MPFVRALALFALLASACTPSTDRPITNAGPVLALLGSPATHVYAVDPDPDCPRDGEFWAKDSVAGCFRGLTVGEDMWLLVRPADGFLDTSISHEAQHRLGHHHGDEGWPEGTNEAAAINLGNFMIEAAGMQAIEINGQPAP